MFIEPHVIPGIIYLLIAVWFAFTEIILEFLGFVPDEVSFFPILLLWLAIIFVVSVVFIVIFRAFKNFFKFLFKLNSIKQ